VFSGGWTLEAMEAVCADPVDSGQLSAVSNTNLPFLSTVNCQPATHEVADLLAALVDQSLVVYEEQDGQARYRLMETVRQYARDRLLEMGEAGEVRERHLGFFLALAERAEPELRGSGQAAWFGRLEAEHDNLRAALEWSRTGSRDATAGLRLTGALWWFWSVRGHWQEGSDRLAEVLRLKES